MRVRNYRAPISEPTPAAIGHGSHVLARTGFSLVEILLAVALFGLLAVTALHSRAVMIRAEQKARRMDAARLIMREVVTLSRAGITVDELIGRVSTEWRLTATEVVTDDFLTGDASAHPGLTWRIWQLDAVDGAASLEVAMEVLAAGAGEVAHE